MENQKSQVRCGVTGCLYNKDRLCRAGNLVINPMGDNVVNSNAGTQCDTFKNRSTM